MYELLETVFCVRALLTFVILWTVEKQSNKDKFWSNVLEASKWKKSFQGRILNYPDFFVSKVKTFSEPNDAVSQKKASQDITQYLAKKTLEK